MRSDYFRQTRTGTYGFWAALPLLLAYEVLILVANRGNATEVRVGPDIWIKQLLALVGGTGHLFLGGLVAVIGLAIFLAERKRGITLRGKYFLLMLGESVVYAILVAVMVSSLTQYVFSALVPMAMPAEEAGNPVLFHLALSLGAGLYEELFFRVALVGAVFVVLDHLTARRTASYVVATVVGAALFSGVHHLGPFGDPFTAPVFFYRFLFGIVLQILLVARGFGIAAWTHALYDVLVVMMHGG